MTFLDLIFFIEQLFFIFNQMLSIGSFARRALAVKDMNTF